MADWLAVTVQRSSPPALPSLHTRYKWGQVTHNSVGVITAISRNGKDVTVNYPEQANWTGLISEMEIVPSVHMWFR